MLVAVIAIGLVSIDPVAPAILFKGITDGASRQNVIVFTLAVCVAMVLAGVTLAAIGTLVLGLIEPSLPSGSSDGLRAALGIGLAFVLIAWLLYSGLTGTHPSGRSHDEKAEQGLLRGSVIRVGTGGAAYGLTALLNPVLVALAVTLASLGSGLALLGGITLWTLIAECLLLGLFAAYLLGAHERAVRVVTAWTDRHRTSIRVALYTLAAVAAVLLAYDGISYFAG